MVLNMADFGKHACKAVLKWYVTACATVFVDLGWIREGRELADFEHKAWL